VEEARIAKTRGEYQPFDLARQLDREGVFSFVSPTIQNLKILLKRDATYVIDGEKIKTPLVEAQFRDYRFDTRDESIATMVRKSRMFRAGKIKELDTARNQSKAARIEAIASQLSKDPELAALVVESLRAKEGAAVPISE